MNGRIIIFLPATAEHVFRWLRVDGGHIVARGEGLPRLNGQAPVVAVVPSADVALHWAELPDRSSAQSLAAARVIMAERCAAPIAQLHVAIGREEEGAARPIAVAAMARMEHWQEMLAANGVDCTAMLPAALLLARPENGYVRAEVGDETVVRGPGAAFVDEAGITALITGGAAPVTLEREALEASIVAATAFPALDLRQGGFARRRRAIDWRWVRRLGWLLAALLAVSVAIALVQLARYSFAAQALEQRAEALARQGLPPGETAGDAARQLRDRVAGLRGAGLGFSRSAAAVFSAVQGVPGSELHTLSFDANGDVRMTLATQTEGQIIDVKNRLEAMGFIVEPRPFTATGGRFTGEFVVSKP